MEELNGYGRFIKRYEGVGQLLAVGKPEVPAYFDIRHLADGRLLIGCVSAGAAIETTPSWIGGYLLSGEQFDAQRGIEEVYRSPDSEKVTKAHYFATYFRVRYTKDAQPDNHAIEFALHNFIPGRASGLSEQKTHFTIRGHSFALFPDKGYGQRSDELLRYGGNIRTSWVRTQFVDEPEKGRMSWDQIEEAISGLLNALSLATGTLVTSPQRVTWDPKEERNDVERYASDAKLFSQFIPNQGWDTSIISTIEAWFSGTWPVPAFSADELSVWIRQHLDACAREVYLETRALAAATLLDVMAGRYCREWTTTLPKDVPFKKKLKRLLKDIGIALPEAKIDSIIKARNSLVHAGKFVTTESDATFAEYKNLVLLGRSMLLRMIAFPSNLHDAITV